MAAGSRWEAVGAIFDHLWRDGNAGAQATQRAGVGRTLGVGDVAAATASESARATLRAHTDEAIAAGVFGVPTLGVAGEPFRGNDASPMIEAFLDDPGRFDSDAYRRLAVLPSAASRRR